MAIATLSSFDDGVKSGDRRRDHFITDMDLRDEAPWIPYAEGVWFQPCHFNVTTGGFTLLARALPGSRIAKHYHVSPVHGLTLQGKWRYLEHD